MSNSQRPDRMTPQPRNKTATGTENDGELDDTLRSLHDLIKDAPTDASGNDASRTETSDGPIDMKHKDPLRVSKTDPKASTDFPTLTDVVHAEDVPQEDVQRDLFEQLALGDKKTSPNVAAPAKDLLVKADKTSPTPALNPSDESVAPLSTDYAGDAERFAAANFPKEPEPTADVAGDVSDDAPVVASDDVSDVDAHDEAAHAESDTTVEPSELNATDEHEPDDLPQLAGAAAVAASRAVTARSQEDGIPLVTSAINADRQFPDGVFDGPELDEYAGDTLPGGFLPGSVDNRPYEEFGIDELPGDSMSDDIETPAAPYERATIWDDRGPNAFVNIDEAEQPPLVKHSLNANGEPPLDPMIASQIHDALAGLLGKWPESEVEASAADADSQDPTAPQT